MAACRREIMAMFFRSTSDVPYFEKLNYMHEGCRQALVGLEVEPFDIKNYELVMSGVVLDGLSVLRIRSSPCIVTRKADALATERTDSLIFQAVLSGEMHVEQGDNASLLAPGDSFFYSTDRASAFTIPTPHEVVVVKLPRKTLMINGDINGIAGRNLSQTTHIAPVLFSFVTNMSDHAANISNQQIERLVGNLGSLLETTIDGLSPQGKPRLPFGRSDTLERIKAFIRRNLSDLDLSPSKVADVSRLSTRYLNRLLEHEGTSLSRFIWEQRLEKAAGDLANPALRSWSISEIAYNSGFRNISHFSAAFRERFDKAPSEFREQNSKEK
jgi:AraC family transcriptional activator of tynA and feaB